MTWRHVNFVIIVFVKFIRECQCRFLFCNSVDILKKYDKHVKLQDVVTWLPNLILLKLKKN